MTAFEIMLTVDEDELQKYTDGKITADELLQKCSFRHELDMIDICSDMGIFKEDDK